MTRMVTGMATGAHLVSDPTGRRGTGLLWRQAVEMSSARQSLPVSVVNLLVAMAQTRPTGQGWYLI